MDKKSFYSLKKTVDKYDSRRFGGKSGQYINDRELNIVLGLLPEKCKILDFPVGTGRLSLFLKEKGYDCHGIDYSEEMIELSKSRGLLNVTQGDLFEMEMEKDTFDAVVSLRFFFHFHDIKRILEQAFTTLRSSGVYVFDTFNRSPRAWLPFLGKEGRVYLHKKSILESLARETGFIVERKVSCFLFSPLIYRFLPFPVVKSLDRMEKKLPEDALVRVFWKLSKP